jgi:hypothetical protein
MCASYGLKPAVAGAHALTVAFPVRIWTVGK